MSLLLVVYLAGCLIVGCAVVILRRTKASEDGGDFKPRPLAVAALGVAMTVLWPGLVALAVLVLLSEVIGIYDEHGSAP